MTDLREARRTQSPDYSYFAGIINEGGFRDRLLGVEKSVVFTRQDWPFPIHDVVSGEFPELVEVSAPDLEKLAREVHRRDIIDTFAASVTEGGATVTYPAFNPDGVRAFGALAIIYGMMLKAGDDPFADRPDINIDLLINTTGNWLGYHPIGRFINSPNHQNQPAIPWDGRREDNIFTPYDFGQVRDEGLRNWLTDFQNDAILARGARWPMRIGWIQFKEFSAIDWSQPQAGEFLRLLRESGILEAISYKETPIRRSVNVVGLDQDRMLVFAALAKVCTILLAEDASHGEGPMGLFMMRVVTRTKDLLESSCPQLCDVINQRSLEGEEKILGYKPSYFLPKEPPAKPVLSATPNETAVSDAADAALLKEPVIVAEKPAEQPQQLTAPPKKDRKPYNRGRRHPESVRHGPPKARPASAAGSGLDVRKETEPERLPKPSVSIDDPPVGVTVAVDPRRRELEELEGRLGSSSEEISPQKLMEVFGLNNLEEAEEEAWKLIEEAGSDRWKGFLTEERLRASAWRIRNK